MYNETNLDKAIKMVNEEWKKSEDRSRSALNAIVQKACILYDVNDFTLCYSLGIA